MELKFISHVYPTPDFPYFGVRIAVTGITADTTVSHCEGNNFKWLRDVYVFNNGIHNRKGILSANVYNELRIACNDSEINVAFSSGELLEISCPPVEENGWFLPAWKYCAAIVLDNPNDIDRENEPVHQPIAVYLDRLADPVREVRVVAVCPETGNMREIPSQVYNVSKWEGFADKHCQPTMNFDVAFSASVKANAKRVYLIFYGNPNAEKPNYKTNLTVSGEGRALTIENAFYRVKLHEPSGGIDEMTVKQGVNQTFAHHLETNGSMNWSPDFYAPPTPWNHISDWDPPENFEVDIGPVFAMVKRWGTMPMYDDVKISVTYLFYADYRPIVISTSMELTKDRDVIALRGSEIVVNRELTQEIAWRNMDGTYETACASDLPRHPTMGKRLPGSTPWVALYNREYEALLAVAYIENANVRRDGGLERIDQHLYVHVGPWVYIARPLLYTFVGNNPQRVMHAYGNTLHYEKIAWLPMRMNESAFDDIEDATNSLRLPLQTCVVLDTDERVPTEWIPPILLAEFDEL
ncbi:MAG: hypothetical protein FWF15_06830 [Oscillospiraceae bacterium]|nr:hypothetical protein [Oscillospiraceae bacterium]